MSRDQPVYELLALLGEGGMGSVYRAAHRPSNREVAVKTLRSSMSNPQSRRLLLREAAAVAGLDHPNIVRLIDLTEDADGRPALVMELVDGSDLRALLGRWPGFATVTQVLCDALDGLAAAHGAGIVHRDLKPENVLIDADGRGKLTDFGVAEILDPLARDSPERRPAGTPEYMAPEQLDARGDLGPWTDLYAVGVILHEMIFDAQLFQAETIGELIAQKKRPPRFGSTLRDGLAVPDGLLSLVQSLLEPDPSRRPRFAHGVMKALAAAIPDVTESASSVDRGPVVTTAATHTASPATLPADDLGYARTIGAQSPAALADRGRVRVTAALSSMLPAAPTPGASVDVVRLRRPALVGRRSEREALWSAATRVCERRAPEVAMLMGPAGAGKSALARWGLSEVERHGLMEGAAAAYDLVGGDVDGGLRRAVRRLVRSPTESDEGGPRFRWLHAEGGSGEPDVDEPMLAAWLRGRSEGQLSRDRAVALSAAVVRRAAQRCPVYLWLDDAGWSRDGALSLTRALLSDHEAPILVVLTLRSGTALHGAVREELAPLESAATRIDLGDLDDVERRALLTATIGVAEPVADQLASRLPGGPLELLTRVRAWVDSGDLVPSPAGYTLAAHRSAGELFTERSLTEALRARVASFVDAFGDQWSAAEQVLLIAALLGTSFEERIVRLGAERSGVEVDPAAVLDRAVLHGLLLPEQDRRRLRFDHGLLREVLAQEAQTHVHKTALQRAAAEALTTFYDASQVEAGERAAELFAGAGDVRRGVELLLESGATRLRMGDLPIAEAHVRRAASWLDDAEIDDADVLRGQALFLSADHLYYAFRYAESEARLADAMRVFEAAGDALGMTRARLLLSGLHLYQDRLADAESVVRDVLSAGVGLDAINRGFANHRLMQIQLLRGRLADAYVSGQRAIAFSRAAKNWRRHRLAHLALIETELCMGRITRARARLAAVQASAGMNQDSVGLGYVQDLEIFFACVEGRPADVAESCRALYAASKAKGDAWRGTFYLAFQLVIDAPTAPLAQLEALVDQFIAWFEKAPNDEPPARWAMHRALERLDERGVGDSVARLRAIIDRRNGQLLMGLGAGEVLWDPGTLTRQLGL